MNGTGFATIDVHCRIVGVKTLNARCAPLCIHNARNGLSGHPSLWIHPQLRLYRCRALQLPGRLGWNTDPLLYSQNNHLALVGVPEIGADERQLWFDHAGYSDSVDWHGDESRYARVQSTPAHSRYWLDRMRNRLIPSFHSAGN